MESQYANTCTHDLTVVMATDTDTDTQTQTQTQTVQIINEE